MRAVELRRRLKRLSILSVSHTEANGKYVNGTVSLTDTLVVEIVPRTAMGPLFYIHDFSVDHGETQCDNLPSLVALLKARTERK